MNTFKVALQLYSIREDMEKDMAAALKQVKAMGYDYVEFAGYFGKSAEEVRALLDENGLSCISVHQMPDLFEEQGQAAVDYLKTIGAQFCAIPAWPPEKLQEGPAWEESKALFMRTGRLLKENGIGALYHNHDFEFKKVNNEYILDRIFREIPAELLNPQVDTCWASYAGLNPAEYLLKYTGRIRVVHLKDYVCTKKVQGPVYNLIGKEGGTATQGSGKKDDGFEFRPLGSGVQDMPAILAAAGKAGARCVVVEQDEPFGFTAMECAEKSRQYLSTLGI